VKKLKRNATVRLSKPHTPTKELSNGLELNATEAMQTCTFVCGSRGTGKSDTAMYIADQLKHEGINICVFDSSLDWIRRGSISQYVTVQQYSRLEVPEQSMIFDISRLTPLQQQECVENFNRKLFEAQLNSDKWFYLVFEEAQLHFPLNSIRGKRFQNSARILTVGRNVGISMCAISQFPALIEKELIKNAQQIYIGCTAEPNTLAYWRGMLGSKTDKLKKLQNGQFLYYNRNKISEIEIQPFQYTAPKTEIMSKVTQTTQPSPKGTQTDYGALVKALVISTIGLVWLWIQFGGH
jgi:hypothetical protein